MQHVWTWAVVYEDGTERFEDELGGFGAVDIDRVRTLVVMAREGDAHYAVHITDGMRPIFFRRVRKLQINDANEPIPAQYVRADGTVVESYVHATVLGWQKTVNGRNVKSLTWLMFDGSVAITDCDMDDL